MEIVVKKVIDTNGVVSVFVNEIILWKNGFFQNPRACSNAITGAKAVGNGIFTYGSIGGTEQFWFGSFMKDVEISAIQAIFQKNAADIDIGVLAKEIAITAQPVIDWVESCRRLVGETAYTVSVNPAPEPESDIDMLFRISEEAKNNSDFDIANICFDLLRDKQEQLSFEYEVGQGKRNGDNTYFDLATIRYGEKSVCIPIPLLKRDAAIYFALRGTKVECREHTRSPNDFDYKIQERHRSELAKVFMPKNCTDSILLDGSAWSLWRDSSKFDYEGGARKRRVVRQKPYTS